MDFKRSSKDFEYKYRGCTVYVEYDGGLIFISVYDDENDFDYGYLNSYEKMYKKDLIEEGNAWVDNIREHPEAYE